MQIRTLLTSGALFAALGLFGNAVCAQSAATMDDAAIKADEAAEAEAKAAEAVEEAAVAREKKEAAEGAKFHSEEVSGDMNPVDEGDAAQMKEPK
jgi:hypothetical protein